MTTITPPSARPTAISAAPSAIARPELAPTLRQRWQRFPSTPCLWLSLLLLTAIGAFLRFWRLDLQAYWTDEGYTIQRIAGTFNNTLQQLTDQGFPPGWYVLLRLWRIVVEGHVHTPADAYWPGYLRILPAIIGTLTVPAMYFLARQFTDRKGALLVMFLTAVNPFLIYYSRDIKMYAALWFIVILNSAIFFHWQTTRRHLLWFPLYLITGVCMTAMHVMAFFMIAFHLIFLLTRPKPRPWDAPLWLVATGAMAWIPYYWYFVYLQPYRYLGRVNSDGQAHGMDWIRQYTDMSWTTIASLPTVHLFGFLWPVYPPDKRMINWFMLGNDFKQHLATRSWPWMANGEWYAAVLLLSILLVGLIPWRGIRKSPEREASVTRGRWWWVLLWIAIPCIALALTWIPEDSDWYYFVWRGAHPKALWEPRYLGIVVPAFLLWLAASLRRLPTVPLRALAILLVLFVCTFSSLSNHLIYRNEPADRIAAMLERHINPNDREATAVGFSDVAYPSPAHDVAVINARHIVPGSLRDDQYVPRHFWDSLAYSDTVDWLRARSQDFNIRTILLADKYGDLTDPSDRLSDESIARLLGPRWKLVDRDSYVWHYEWRFYIFHIWRIRVWERTAPRPIQ